MQQLRRVVAVRFCDMDCKGNGLCLGANVVFRPFVPEICRVRPVLALPKWLLQKSYLQRHARNRCYRLRAVLLAEFCESVSKFLAFATNSDSASNSNQFRRPTPEEAFLMESRSSMRKGYL